MRKFCRDCMCLVAAMLMAMPASATRWYVTTTGTGTGTGSWQNACTLKYALDPNQAQSGDEIWVAEGIYKPDQNDPNVRYCAKCRTLKAKHATFRLRDGISLYGGFGGPNNNDPNNPYPGESNLNERNELVHQSVLSGGINDPSAPDDIIYDVWHVVTAHNVGPGTKLSGFTIIGGNANSDDPNDVYERFGAAVLIVGTHADPNDPETPLVQSSLHITRCRFIVNQAVLAGGGIAVDWLENPPDPNDAEPARIVNCKFRYCLASDQDLGAGGAIAVRTASFEATNCVINDNTAGALGGGISCDDPNDGGDRAGQSRTARLRATSALQAARSAF